MLLVAYPTSWSKVDRTAIFVILSNTLSNTPVRHLVVRCKVIGISHKYQTDFSIFPILIEHQSLRLIVDDFIDGAGIGWCQFFNQFWVSSIRSKGLFGLNIV